MGGLLQEYNVIGSPWNFLYMDLNNQKQLFFKNKSVITSIVFYISCMSVDYIDRIIPVLNCDPIKNSNYFYGFWHSSKSSQAIMCLHKHTNNFPVQLQLS